MSAQPVAALYVKRNTIYREFEGVEVFDVRRDARSFAGGVPVVAHPPCRLWCRLSHLSTAPDSERELAFHALEIVRRDGGVLEHPAYSKLWRVAGLPAPGRSDAWGFTVHVDQYWFGHACQKPTWLYVVGLRPAELPPYPLALGFAPRVFGRNAKHLHGPLRRPGLHDAERSSSPAAFAAWLLSIARASRPCPSIS